MNYQETIDYLFHMAPLFQMKGAGAYKEGLENTLALDAYFQHPHQSYRCIHVAGTNGKGSTAHTLAAILQEAGYKVGLYTSPHLVDFRERIRVNGKMIPQEEVIRFVEQHRSFFEPLHPSFFELATAMAFQYFRSTKVDVAVIEVGLGGRLDCTNIIRPDLSIITNISFDHIQFLGNTLEKIAGEKAGIIKKEVPVVIGETQEETTDVFLRKAREVGSGPVVFADQQKDLDYSGIDFELKGIYQEKNLKTILTAVRLLQGQGYRIQKEHIQSGCRLVMELTGLRGRWQVLGKDPLIVCDAGHNVGGISYVSRQLKALEEKGALHIVFGMVNDKDISGVLDLLPARAHYYFTQASVERALRADLMKEKAAAHGLSGECYPCVPEALEAALKAARKEDTVFIGGSCFIVADLMSALENGFQL